MSRAATDHLKVEVSMTWPQYQRGCCVVDGEHVYLTPTQTEILVTLLLNRGRLFDREELWEIVWPDPDYAADIKNVDVQIHKLRQRLGGVIESEWGRGYRVPLPGHEADQLHYRDANSGDEAAAFVALNQMRRPLSALDLFKAAVAAEDKEALLIVECLAAAALRIAPHSNYNAWKPGMLQNIGSIRECLRTKGERTLRESLVVLGQAYGAEIIRYAGTIFPGIAHIVSSEHQKGGEDKFGARMIAMVKTRTQRQWADQIIKASTDHPRGRRGAAWQVFADAWLQFTTAPVHHPNAASVILNSDEIAWCEQCQRKVGSDRAAACTDRFCSMRKAQAA